MGRSARLVTLLVALSAGALPAHAADPSLPRAGLSAGERDFIAKHWGRAIAPQGLPPARFSPLERTFQPDACGACHPVLFGDWQASIHSRSMGPGVTGQLVGMARPEHTAALSCSKCHAPVAEQRALLVEPSGALAANPAFDPELEARGVICASCHVRSHEHFGPPRRDGSTASRGPRESLPHGGVTRTTAFLRAEF